MMAWRAALLELARKDHQLINRYDRMPTPSQPMKRLNRLLALTRIIIIRINTSRWLKKEVIFGSEDM